MTESTLLLIPLIVVRTSALRFIADDRRLALNSSFCKRSSPSHCDRFRLFRRFATDALATKAFLRSRSSVNDLQSLDLKFPAPTSWTEIGFARRHPLLSVIRHVAEILELQSFDSDSHRIATERLSVCLFAVRWLGDLQECATEQLRLLQTLMRRGIDYLLREGAKMVLSEVESFCLPLQEIAVSAFHFFASSR